MRLDVKRQLFARSDRVKGIDFHPSEPWVLATLYSGHVNIWSYETQSIIKSFEVTDVPVRAGRFIARKNWIVVGSDDFQLRVYNYNTSEKITQFEAHPDYIRAIVVHPTQPFVLTASDDMTIKLWNWEKGWQCMQTFEGHSHYVMSLAINPKDTNTFASACLDRTVKIWSLGGAGKPNYTLEAHETKGVNHVDYYPAADKPYILTTSDDRTIKIWDYTTKALVATLEGHTSNVSFACYHPELPVIISGSEDGTIKIWHANTHRLEQTLNYNLERAWCVSYQKGKNGIGIGFDDGVVVIKMGREEPAISMDQNGKLIWAKQNEVVSSVVRPGDATTDGESLILPTKDLGTCEVFPSVLKHSPNGRFVAVCGDGEYIIYTSLAWRNKEFGSALDFVWSTKDQSTDYAIRESSTSVKIFKNFKERPEGPLDVGFSAEGLFGGFLLAVKGNGFVALYDWDSGELVRRIDVVPTEIYWSEGGELFTIACEDTFYVLRYSREAYLQALQEGAVDDDGVEAAFEVVTDISETVRTGEWVGDCFIYTNSTNRLNYLVGDQTYLITSFDKPMYLIGYLQRDGRLYLSDKDVNITSYSLSVSVIEYQTLVLRGEMELAAEILNDIPEEGRNKIARFLEGQGHKELALEIATDPEQRFDLSLALGQLDTAVEIAREADSDQKWKVIGDAALANWDLVLAEESFVQAKDLGSLLLLHTSTGNTEGLRNLAELAQETGANNIAFTALWFLGQTDESIALLEKSGRHAEAALFAHTYKPSAVQATTEKWKEALIAQEKGNKDSFASRKKLIERIGEPEENKDLFPEWDSYLTLEKEYSASTNGNLIDLDGPQAAAATEEETTSSPPAEISAPGTPEGEGELVSAEA